MSEQSHDCQVEGVCQSLDGADFLAITLTGSGKTGYYIMYMLVILVVLKNSDHFPSLHFPRNPCLIVICPTIGNKHAISAPGLLY